MNEQEKLTPAEIVAQGREAIANFTDALLRLMKENPEGVLDIASKLEPRQRLILTQMMEQREQGIELFGEDC